MKGAEQLRLAFDSQPLFVFRKSSLVGLWLETFLYGIYAVLFGICLYIFWCSPKSRNPVLIISAVSMFSLSTAHMILDVITTLGIDMETGLYNRPTAVAAVFLYLTNSGIADTVIIYRCYIVWGFNRYMILPIILVITSTIYGYTMGLSVGTISITLGTNIIVTGLTAGRIWWSARKTGQVLGGYYKQKYGKATALVLESGAIYCISVLVLLVFSRIELGHRRYVPANDYACELPNSYIVYLVVSQLVGIVPTLIIVRVGINLKPNVETTLPALAKTHQTLEIAFTTEITNDRAVSLLSSNGVVVEKSSRQTSPSIDTENCNC